MTQCIKIKKEDKKDYRESEAEILKTKKSKHFDKRETGFCFSGSKEDTREWNRFFSCESRIEKSDSILWQVAEKLVRKRRDKKERQKTSAQEKPGTKSV